MEERVCLKWFNHQQNFGSLVSSVFQEEHFCDATIAVDGRSFPVHKLVLIAASDYFRGILCEVGRDRYLAGDLNPVFLLDRVCIQDMAAILDYIYYGQTEVASSQLTSLVATAQYLGIKSLCHVNILSLLGSDSDEERSSSNSPQKKSHELDQTKTLTDKLPGSTCPTNSSSSRHSAYSNYSCHEPLGSEEVKSSSTEEARSVDIATEVELLTEIETDNTNIKLASELIETVVVESGTETDTTNVELVAEIQTAAEEVLTEIDTANVEIVKQINSAPRDGEPEVEAEGVVDDLTEVGSGIVGTVISVYNVNTHNTPRETDIEVGNICEEREGVEILPYYQNNGPQFRKNQSKVWLYFEKIAGGEMVKCQLCGINQKYLSHTTSMARHIRSKHKDIVVPESNPTNLMKGRRKHSRRSDVWQHFVMEMGNTKVKCKLCLESYVYCHNTTNLRLHLKTKHKDVWE